MVDKSQSEFDAETKAEVLLMLALDDGSPEGTRPTREDIAAWHEGLVDAKKRAQEIKSWIVRDSECYQVYHDLLSAEMAIDSITVQTKRSIDKPGFIDYLSRILTVWTIPKPALAASLAVFILSIVLIPRFVNDPQYLIDAGYTTISGQGMKFDDSWPWNNDLQTKSVDLTELLHGGIDKNPNSSFLFGIRNGLETLSFEDQAALALAIQGLPDRESDCSQDTNVSNCVIRQKLSVLTGRWAILNYAGCNAVKVTGISSEFWVQQSNALEKIIRKSHSIESLSPVMKILSKTEANDLERHEICELSDQLIQIAIQPH